MEPPTQVWVLSLRWKVLLNLQLLHVQVIVPPPSREPAGRDENKNPYGDDDELEFKLVHGFSLEALELLVVLFLHDVFVSSPFACRME